jgi:hypothetical protein
MFLRWEESKEVKSSYELDMAAVIERQRTELDVAYFSQRTGEERKLSHKYHEAWEPEDLFCPQCGQKHVWRCDSGGDHYVGEQYLCTACKSTFYLPSGVQDATGEQNEQRLLSLTPNVGGEAPLTAPQENTDEPK